MKCSLKQFVTTLFFVVLAYIAGYYEGKYQQRGYQAVETATSVAG